MSVVKSEVRAGAPPGPLTILHVIAPAAVGGLERVVEALAVGHAQLGHRVHVAAVLADRDAEPAFLSMLRVRGVAVHVLQTPAHAYRSERAFVAGLCRSLRPDVVHTHGYRSDVVDSGVARRAGVATVTTVHGFTGGRGRARLYEWLQLRSHPRFDAVVAVSRAQTHQLESAGVSRSKLFLIQNAWSDSAKRLDRHAARGALGVPADAFHIGWVGRLSAEKAPGLLIEAARHLAARGIPIQVSIIGDGAEREQLQRAASRLGLSDRVRFHGALENAARLFEGFDVFVLSSRTEGTPIVLFEAMAARVPIVTTNVGGIPDVVGLEHARLVSPGDATALAAAIGAVWSDPEEARRRAQAAAIRLSERFQLHEWLAAYESIYKQINHRHGAQQVKNNP